MCQRIYTQQSSGPHNSPILLKQWEIVDRNEKLNSNVKSSISNPPNSFVTAKGIMPLKYKIVEHTSTKHKADNQCELHAIKRLKTFHNASKDTAKQKNENESDRSNKKQKLVTFDEDDAPSGTQWDGENYSCAYDSLFRILFSIWVSKPKK